MKKTNYPDKVDWNKDLKFDETYETLRLALTSNSIKNKKFRGIGKKVKISILFIALRNGCRLSEAIRSYNLFIETGQREVKTRVGKRGFAYIRLPDGGRKRKTTGKEPDEPVERKVVIPAEISDKLPGYRLSKSNITQFARRNFAYNPHSLRYAFITHMGKDKGIAAQLIAKMTMHAGINEIIRYTQQSEADDILRDGVL